MAVVQTGGEDLHLSKAWLVPLLIWVKSVCAWMVLLCLGVQVITDRLDCPSSHFWWKLCPHLASMWLVCVCCVFRTVALYSCLVEVRLCSYPLWSWTLVHAVLTLCPFMLTLVHASSMWCHFVVFLTCLGLAHICVVVLLRLEPTKHQMRYS